MSTPVKSSERIRPHMGRLHMILSALLFAAISSSAFAAPALDVQLTIKNQNFQPDTLTIPPNRTVKIMVKNEDVLPAEFESSELNREKVIPGGTIIPVYVGPLPPGTYNFFNDFHPESKGQLIVKPAKH